MDFDLTTGQSELATRARRFARETVLPRVDDYDRAAAFPWDVFTAACAAGLLHLTVPAADGGPGLGLLEQVLVADELAWACVGICAAVSLNALAVTVLTEAGRPEQRKEYLPRLLAGEVCGFALSEPDAGSDLGALTTTARPAPGGFVLNGHKTWISNAPDASFFVVFARTSPSALGAFLVDGRAGGVTIGPARGTLGQRATAVADVVLSDVGVPAEALVGPVDGGFGLAMHVFDHSRPLIGAYGVGLTARCLHESVTYSRRRRTMGRPIHQHQAVAHKIAEMGLRLAAARLLTRHAAWLCDQGRASTLASAYAKTYAADTAVWAATETVQIFGGAGYGTDLPIEKLYRDAKLLQIYEGTGEIQRGIMAGELVRAGGEEL